jgi:glutamine synthetase
MASGWHLHQSLVGLADGRNALRRDAPAPGSTPLDAGHVLSDPGVHYLAGLLAHARGMASLCTPTINGYGRFRPHALAPQAALWGRDNRGALLRVVGDCGDEDTRIENRIGEPAANPYLYLAAQVHAGLDGIERALTPPAATEDPYRPAAAAGGDGAPAPRLPTTLAEALRALDADAALRAGFGDAFVDHFLHVKQAEVTRHAEAADKDGFERREYFGRL